MSQTDIQNRISAHGRSAKDMLARKGDRAWSVTDQATFDQHVGEVERAQAELTSARLVDQQLTEIERTRNQASAAERMQREMDNAPAWARDWHQLKAAHRAGLDIYLRKAPQTMSDEEAKKVRATMGTTIRADGGYTA